jgi:hypothetical protein
MDESWNLKKLDEAWEIESEKRVDDGWTLRNWIQTSWTMDEHWEIV